MHTETAIISHRAATLGSTEASIHGMYGFAASIALEFRAKGHAAGLSAGSHGTTDEMRRFAAELIRHCDITDAAQAKIDPGATVDAFEGRSHD